MYDVCETTECENCPFFQDYMAEQAHEPDGTPTGKTVLEMTADEGYMRRIAEAQPKTGDKVWVFWDSGETEAWTKATVLCVIDGMATLDVEHGKQHKLAKVHVTALAKA